MIKTFKSKALKQFWGQGNKKGLIQDHVTRIDRMLTLLDASTSADDMMLPSYNTHALKGNRAGTWASTVRANWRLTYGFDGQDAVDVDYEDYH
jgi:proteic killer suppression protein